LKGLAAIPGVSWWDKKRLLRLPRLMARYRPLLDPTRPELAASLDFRSARDFATLYFGRSLWEYWLSPATTSEYVSDELELSRVAFLLARVASQEGRAPLGVLRRGLRELADRAAGNLGVQLGAEVEEIRPRPGGGYVIEGVAGDAAAPAIEVDAVVVATSAQTAHRIAAPLVVPAERDFFNGLRCGPRVMMTIALDETVGKGERFVRVPKAEASSIECYLSEIGSHEGRAPEGKGLVGLVANQRFAMANASATDEVIEKSLLAGFSRFHPRAGDSVAFTRIRRESTGVPLFHVGAYRALEGFQRVQLDRGEQGRRIYFAGDYLSGVTPNQAVNSGRRAAALLRSHFE
jgi:oxygen-dependent protoporphyrinogen oxidase